MENKNTDKIEDLIRCLARASQASHHYGKDHRITLSAINDLFEVLDIILIDRDYIVIGIIGDEIAFENEPLFKSSRSWEAFIQDLKELGIEKIRFSLGIRKYEIIEFINVLGGHITFTDIIDNIQTYLLSKNIKHIQLEKLNIKEKIDDFNDLDHFTQTSFNEGLQFLQETSEGLANKNPINMQILRKISSNLVKSILFNENLLLLLASIKINQEDLLIHNLNVCVFTLMQAEMLGLEKKFLVQIGEAALMHNLGDIIESKSDEKDGKYFSNTDGIRSFQADKGAKVLLETKGMHILAPIVSFEHTIKYDQTGISWKLFGENLNLISMMIAISKFYDNNRRKSSLDESSRPENVYEDMMSRSGKDFHPVLLKNFFTGLGVYPAGTLVELSNHEIGLVIQRSIMDIRRPKVKILYDKNGNKYEHTNLVNLREKNLKGEYRLSIIHSVVPEKQIQIPSDYTRRVNSN
ncbi:MAG: hypothetical protein R6V04_06565 [bacterium]